MAQTTIPEFVKFGEASSRIGHSPAATMRWIIDFSKRDLKVLTSDQQEQLSYEIAHFSYFGFEGSSRFTRITEGFSEITSKHFSIPSPTKLAGFQALVRSSLLQLLDDGATELRLSSLTMYVSRSRIKGKHGKTYFKGEIGEAFKLYFAELLYLHANWIRLCKASDQCPSPLYLAIHHHQKYCPEGGCQSRMSTQRWRNKRKRSKVEDRKASRKSGKGNDSTRRGGMKDGTKRRR